jgi:hypothetical protein
MPTLRPQAGRRQLTIKEAVELARVTETVAV